MIAGNVEGDIVVRGDVTIDDGAQCASNVEGHAVTVGGSLEGDVAATGAITIGASGRVRGNVRGASFAMDDGASFAGRNLIVDPALIADFALAVQHHHFRRPRHAKLAHERLPAVAEHGKVQA